MVLGEEFVIDLLIPAFSSLAVSGGVSPARKKASTKLSNSGQRGSQKKRRMWSGK
jgi:hypothetical protein